MSTKAQSKKARPRPHGMAALLAAFCVLAAVTLAGAYQAQQALPPYVGKDLTEEEAAEVIARNSPLTSYVRLSPNADFPREEKITKITIHPSADGTGRPPPTTGSTATGMSASMWKRQIVRGQAPALKTIMRQSPSRWPTRRRAVAGGSVTRPMRRLSPCVRTSAGAMAWKSWSTRGTLAGA